MGFVALAIAQSSFQVASIKANHSGERIMHYQPQPGGGFTATNCSLSLLIRYAYGLYSFQISGAPGWVQSDRYDIAAKSGNETPTRDIPAMVQRLLEDRFQLQYHWESKEASAYALVVIKPGRLRAAAPGDCPPDAGCGALLNIPGNTSGRQLTSADLAASLATFVARPVVDKTALAGKCDVELQWTPDDVRRPDADAPSIFTALQDQLGLKLESARTSVKTFVIDRVAKPSEN